jgi:O-antigen/teichoic acid export membrane protein
MSLTRRIVRAGSWALGGQALSHLLRLASNLVLTRLLVPEMFGLMALVAVTLTMLQLLTDVGLREVVVRSARGAEKSFCDTVWTIQIIRGAVLYGVCLMVVLGLAVMGHWVGPEGDFALADPRLPWLLALGGLVLPISGLQSTKMYTALREFRGADLVRVEVISQAVALCVAVVLAYATASIWALVASNIVGAALAAVLSHVSIAGYRNNLAWNKADAAEVFRIGKWVAGSSILNLLTSCGDRILLGILVTPAQLGIYSIAHALTGMVQMTLNSVSNATGLPALSEVARSNAAELGRAYYRLRFYFDAACLSISGFLFGAGVAIVDFLYDDRYLDAGQFLSILAVGLIWSRYSVSGHLYLSLGRPRYLMLISIVNAASLYSLMPIGYAVGGMEGAIWALAIREAAAVPVYLWLNAKIGVLDWRQEAKVLPFWPLGWGAGVLTTWLAAGVGP